MQIFRFEDKKKKNTLILTRASFFIFYTGKYFIQGENSKENIIVFYLFYSKFIILRFLFLFISSCYYILVAHFFLIL